MSLNPLGRRCVATVILFLLSAAVIVVAQTPSAPQPSAPASQAPATSAPPSQSQPGSYQPATPVPDQGQPAQPQPIQPADTPPSQDSQQPSAEPANEQGMFVFKKQVEEVVLHATVVDDQHRLVPSLDRSAFSVLQDGVPQTITSFRREDVPVAIGVVIDNSGSMRDKRQQVNQAVLNLVRASNPQDEVFVVNFSQHYYLDQDFTSDTNLLQAALRQVSSRGSTALYDAIVASATHLENNHRLDKKILLVITDGQDNMSQETLQEAMQKLQRRDGPTLYAVGLSGGDLQASGRRSLQDLADATGGVAYFPDTLEQVDQITRSVAHDIRSQYLIAFKPRNQGSQPNYQSLKVLARSPQYGHLTVRTRTGYYTPNPTR